MPWKECYESHSQDVWGEFMEIEDKAESRKKLDEQKKELHKELRDVDRMSFVSNEMQESLMPEHQKAHKKSQKIQNIHDKKGNLQKDSIAAEEEMRKLQQELRQKEEGIFILSNKVDKNKMADADMGAELQSLQAGEERRGSNASAAVWRLCGSNLSPWEQMELIFCTKAPEGNGSSTRADAMKRKTRARQNQSAVWSLIFLVFGCTW